MRNKALIKKVQNFCKSEMSESRCTKLQFHNWGHTEDVVSNSLFIAEKEKLDDEAIEELIIAAYFHDLGNITSSEEHEKRSCNYAEKFLSKEGYFVGRILNVKKIIKATKMPQCPKNIAQCVICDADLAHLGERDFIIKNDNLRQELATYSNLEYTDQEWIAMNIEFLENHDFCTQFARTYYAKQKAKNIEILKILRKDYKL